MANPGAHAVYVQEVPEQLAPMLVAVSHATPQAPQSLIVVVCVSHPFVSGGDVLQSAYPDAQAVYSHVAVPLATSHDSPWLCIMSQAVLHTSQVFDATAVSQPLVSGAVVSQSAWPGLQPV
jgi:hypothetical protein